MMNEEPGCAMRKPSAKKFFILNSSFLKNIVKIIIAGAGAVGTHLAKLLSREKQDIILMDDNEERMSTLRPNFDLMTVTASPTSITGLKEVERGEADLFIAVTPR